jgi:hypothetical protein
MFLTLGHQLSNNSRNPPGAIWERIPFAFVFCAWNLLRIFFYMHIVVEKLWLKYRTISNVLVYVILIKISYGDSRFAV